MIKTKKKSFTKILKELNDIEDKQPRIDEIRRISAELNTFATFIQYTYHPDVILDLPEGDIPAEDWTPSRYDEYGLFINQIAKIPSISTENKAISQESKYKIFCRMLSTVSSEDVPLLIGMKNKRIPFRKITERFCVEAIPELFPIDYKPKDY